MTMQNMVEHLECGGFKVVKEYVVKERNYRFTITKNGLCVDGVFKYPDTDDYAVKDKLQREFLDALYQKWRNAYIETHSKGEKETTMKNYIMELVKHDTGKLTVGDATMDVSIKTVNHDSSPYLEHTEVVLEINDGEVISPITKALRNTIEQILRSYAKAAYQKPEIENVIFNNPATIVFWTDGTKTVVKAQNEPFDPEKGLAMAIAKKSMGNKYYYYHTFKHWLKRYKPNHEKGE